MILILQMIGIWFVSFYLLLLGCAIILAIIKTPYLENETKYVWLFSIILATIITYIFGGLLG